VVTEAVHRARANARELRIIELLGAALARKLTEAAHRPLDRKRKTVGCGLAVGRDVVVEPVNVACDIAVAAFLPARGSRPPPCLALGGDPLVHRLEVGIVYDEAPCWSHES
jgi:hypothetical protein